MVLKKSIFLGEMLIDGGLITLEQLEAALIEHKKTGELTGKTLIKMGFLTEEKLLPVLAEQLSVEYVKLKQVKIDPSVIEKVPQNSTLPQPSLTPVTPHYLNHHS
ncbi:MAG: hypothetical protein L0922_07190, partial [Candidatus Mariimomonas ferrooxydans]